MDVRVDIRNEKLNSVKWLTTQGGYTILLYDEICAKVDFRKQ